MIQKSSHDCIEWRAPFPEFELIRVLFAQLVGRPLPEGYVLRTEGYDWARAMRLVENHRFWGPAARLVREQRAAFPDDFAAGIERRFRAKCLQGMALVHRQVELLGGFRGEGVEITFFKGPVLAQRLYLDLNTRFSHDIDMLVSPREVVQADALMHRLGYTRQDPAIRDDALADYFSRHKHAGYLHSVDRTLVEIHSRLHEDSSEFLVSPEMIARHRIEVDLFGCRIPTFDDEFLLTYLSFHASHHFLLRLFWLADVCVLNRLIGPDRHVAAEEVANACGCAKRLFLCERLGDSMADLSGNVRLAGFPHHVCRYLFGTWEHTHSVEPWFLCESLTRRLNRLCYNAHLIVGPFRKAGFVLNGLFRPGDLDYGLVRLPRFFRWLYFPLRFARLSLLLFSRRRTSGPSPISRHRDASLSPSSR